jgi:hypothetical protein
MRLKPALMLLLPLLAAACAVGPTLEQRLATFIGRGEGDLVAELGVPVRSYETDGRRFLQFERERTVAISQPDPFFYPGPYRYRPWIAPPPAYAQVRCDITFALRDRRVESFTLNGQACG